jgi:imidazolonepropionase-like amidohydrolase
MADATTLVFEGVRLVTPGSDPVDRTNVVVTDGKIADVGPEASVPNAPSVDGSRHTLMPGLIDAHIHLLGMASYDFNVWIMEDPTLHVARAVSHMKALSDAGFTTVRDAGSDTSLALKKAQAEGSIPGPRVWASARWISVTGNLPDMPHLPFCITHNKGMGIQVDGVSESRRAVREQVRAGADTIKIATTGGIDPSFVVAEYTWSNEELAAIVDTAHGLGRRVSVHNNVLPGVPPTGIWRAINAGVDSIDHGYYVEDKVLDAMAEKGVWLIATASYLKLVADNGRDYGLDHVYVDKATIAYESILDTVPRARKAGVKVACGSDLLGTPFDPHGLNAMELPIMREAGFSDREVVDLATTSNAAVLGIEDWTGKISTGMSADLILVDGRPDEDVAILTDPDRIHYVMVGGVVMKDTLAVA